MKSSDKNQDTTSTQGSSNNAEKGKELENFLHEKVFPKIVKNSDGLYKVKSGSNNVHGTESVNNGHKRKDGTGSNPDFVIS